jgi:hypothetical protein
MTARTTGAAALLAAACVAWSALPLRHGGLAATFLVVAIACALLSVARLALGRAPDEAATYLNTVQQSARSVGDLIRQSPWAEGMVVAVLVLEALHRSPAWHTGLLGAALLAYLFASHLAESRARLAVLRPQAPLIAAGLGLLALAVGAAALPSGTGSAAGVLAVLAAVAAVAVAGLVLPV